MKDQKDEVFVIRKKEFICNVGIVAGILLAVVGASVHSLGLGSFVLGIIIVAISAWRGSLE